MQLQCFTGCQSTNELYTNIHTCIKLYFIFYLQYYTLNDWSRGEQWILFPENLKHWDSRETNSLLPKGPVIKWFVIKQKSLIKTKEIFEKRADIPATTSGHLQLHALLTCNSGQHFAGNSEVFPVSRHSFRNVARSWHLAVNSFIVRCHVTKN